MKPFVLGLALLMSLTFQPALVSAQTNAASGNPALTETIAALDTQVFSAYNRCDMHAFGDLFSSDVEFYHDDGGATFDRATVIANTQKYICGKVRRELITSTLRVYPIKDFGAIEEGEHRFCELSGGECDGIAKFLIVWKRTGEKWEITRVLSFGHRSMTENEKAQAKH